MNSSTSKYAYVTIMYGNNIYLTGALVVGFSLQQTKTKLDRIIMVTPDVSTEYKTMLSKVYTHVINIEYVQANVNIFAEETTRFRDVFTKLECLSLIQYEKIILFDLDMVVCKNMDHLFELRSPAACLKRYDVKHGEPIPRNLICKHGNLTGSINAGLMLLKPNLNELDNIKREIMENKSIMKFKYPEQDYLSLRYCSRWTSISFNYNYQFGLTNRTKHMPYTFNDIYVIHYSSSYKPWNDLIPKREISQDETQFKIIHKKYYDLWKGIYDKLKEKFNNEYNLVVPY